MLLYPEVSEQSSTKHCRQGQKGRRGASLTHSIKKHLILLYGFFKMTKGQQVPDPDSELINAQSVDFAKPKLFFENIGCYVATSTSPRCPK